MSLPARTRASHLESRRFQIFINQGVCLAVRALATCFVSVVMVVFDWVLATSVHF